jgi:hypothetical protein
MRLVSSLDASAGDIISLSRDFAKLLLASINNVATKIEVSIQ